jgi:hypothetical protein
MVRSLADRGKTILPQQGFKDLHVQEKKTDLPEAQQGQTSHPPNPGAPRRAVPQARPQVSRNRRRYRPHFVGPFARIWILANGKTPPALPPSENLNRYVEDFDEPRTKQADLFSIRDKGSYLSGRVKRKTAPSCRRRSSHNISSTRTGYLRTQFG